MKLEKDIVSVNAGDLSRFKNAATSHNYGNIDREKNIIEGVSIITYDREARGHGVYIDETFADQVLMGCRDKEPMGLKARYDHPNACARSIGTFLGRFHNFKKDAANKKIIGDLHLDDSAAISPDGNLLEYIITLAETDPDAFATSISFRRDENYIPDPAETAQPGAPPEDSAYWLPHARLKELWGCDVVDQGAANDSLFGRPNYLAEQAERWAGGTQGQNILEKVLDKYFAKKAEKERARKMEHYEEKIEELTAENKTLKEAAEKHEADKKAEYEAGVDEGKELATKMFKARLEMADNDAAFVAENIDKSDEEFKDALIEKLKTAKPVIDTGIDALDTEPSGDSPAGDEVTFDDKVTEYMNENECTRGVAVKACAKQYPELHKKQYRG